MHHVTVTVNVLFCATPTASSDITRRSSPDPLMRQFSAAVAMPKPSEAWPAMYPARVRSARGLPRPRVTAGSSPGYSMPKRQQHVYNLMCATPNFQ